MNGTDFKQFLDGVAGMATKAAGLTVKDYPGAEAHQFILYNNATGTVEVKDKPPAIHSPAVATPPDLADFIKEAKGRYAASERAAVVVAPESVTYYPDHDDQRWSAKSPLTFTPQYRWFLAFGGQKVKQKELVRVLRVTLGGCVPDGVLAGVRQVNWTATTDASVQSHSLGRSVQQAMTSTAAVPDDVSVTLPVYLETLTAQFTFRCYVEVEPDTQDFRLTPYPGALEGIQVDAQRLIAKAFDAGEPRVIVTGK